MVLIHNLIHITGIEEVNGDVYVQIADTTGPFGEPVFEKQNILTDSLLPIFDKFYCHLIYI